MNIVLTGSLGNIGKHLVSLLVDAKHQVTVISSQPERKAAIEAAGAKAAIGSITDSDFLVKSFSNADAVFAMTPPNLGSDQVVEATSAAGTTIAEAVQKAGVQQVVLLSSIGADLPTGNGPIASLHRIEKAYEKLAGVSVVFLRAGLFYTNFYNDVPLIKNAGITGSNYPATLSLPLVHPADIASAAAKALTHPIKGKTVQYIVSDIKTAAEVASTLGAAIGKPELPWVAFSDEQALQGMTQAGLTEAKAKLYIEMGAGFRDGSIPKDFYQQGAPVNGSTKLDQFAREFAAAF